MKKLVLSLLATALMSVLPTNAQSGPKNFMRIDLGFGKISSYAGPCVAGTGMCSGSLSGGNTQFEAGISRVSESVVSYAFSAEFYQANRQYLESGLFIGSHFSLPRSITEKIGIVGEFVVAPGSYAVVQNGDYFYVSITREK